jgi:hypothetical protein
MTSSDPKMPWAWVFKSTGKVAAAALVAFTGFAAAAVRQQQRENAETQRIRWTDANRWE